MEKYNYEEFVSNTEKYERVEMFLQLSINKINDIGNHIIADIGSVRVAINW